uniref:Uncharacterized protein n=1 Tax=viral metagenome TaxID=1070528 RepID=A0A6C0CAL4_9ZZZZ
MNQRITVSLLLKQSFPPEISEFIIWIYAVMLLSQETKPGEIIFDSPCGHILKRVKKSKLKPFTCPINQNTYLFKKDVPERYYYRKFKLTEPYMFLDLEKTYDHLCPPDIGCMSCNQVYSKSAVETDLKLKIVCHCGQFVDVFPCKTCPEKKCCAFECSKFIYEKSSTGLCRHHYRCEKNAKGIYV